MAEYGYWMAEYGCWMAEYSCWMAEEMGVVVTNDALELNPPVGF
jgi:hypothetical protein